MQLKNLSIGKRLGIGFAGLLGLMLAMAVGALMRLGQVDALHQDIEASSRQSALALRWSAQTQVNLARALAVAKADGMPQLQAYLDPQMKETSQRISALQKELEATDLSPDERQALERVAAARQRYVSVRGAVLQALSAGDAQAQAKVDSELLPAAQTYLDSIDTITTLLHQNAQAQAEAGHAMLASTRQLLAVLAGLALLLGAWIAWSLTRSITRPMQRVIDTAEHIAAGHLAMPVKVDRRDELGVLLGSMQRMRDSLHSMVSGIRQGTESITTASQEIASGSQDLSERTEQTAANLQQAASSIEQLVGNVRQTAESARTANQLAADAAQTAERGGSVVGEVVTNMQDITQASRRIADIIGVIDGIAFQTNILALNAAVEAARAGEQGRGFAVVAGEVRSLAGRSAEAAREIKSLIGASVEKVESGSRLVESAGQTMNEIVGSVQRVSDLIGEISAAASEQSDGIAQVNTSVGQLDQMTQQNAALVEESAAAAESLKEQAHGLTQVVSRFELGTGTPARPSNTAPRMNHVSPTMPPVARATRPTASPAPAATPAPQRAPAPVVGVDAEWENF